MKDIQLIDISKIVVNAGTQQRDYDKEVVEDYTNLVKEEVDLPPVEVVFTGKKYILWDGFHRYMAHLNAEADCIQAHVQEGTVDDAIFLSFSANARHGLPLTAAEKKGIIEKILSEPKWMKRFRTQVEIANHVGVTQQWVSKIKKSVDENSHNTTGCKTASTPSETPVVNENSSEDTVSTIPESPQPTTRDAKPMLDKEGREVPRKLVDVFLRANELESRAKVLTDIQNDIISMSSTNDPLIKHLPLVTFMVDITNTRTDLRGAKPHAVCPYCGGDAKGCKHCKGAGWITKSMYDNTPKEFK